MHSGWNFIFSIRAQEISSYVSVLDGVRKTTMKTLSQESWQPGQTSTCLATNISEVCDRYQRFYDDLFRQWIKTEVSFTLKMWITFDLKESKCKVMRLTTDFKWLTVGYTVRVCTRR